MEHSSDIDDRKIQKLFDEFAGNESYDILLDTVEDNYWINALFVFEERPSILISDLETLMGLMSTVLGNREIVLFRIEIYKEDILKIVFRVKRF